MTDTSNSSQISNAPEIRVEAFHKSRRRTNTNLVEVEDQVQFTHVVEVFIQDLPTNIRLLHKGTRIYQVFFLQKYIYECDLYKVVNGLQVEEVVVRRVHTDAEVEPSIPKMEY
jgi:hypothetical protein